MNKMISMYDPSVDAFREFPIDKAKKFVESAKEVEKQIADIQDNIDKEIKELQILKKVTGTKDNKTIEFSENGEEIATVKIERVEVQKGENDDQ